MCLTRVDGRGRLFGRSIDLGPAGIYVTCGELCEIGTELVCAVLLPGGPRRLRGRVVRLVALPNAVGIAVAFTDIKAADRIVIERLVASRLGVAEPVKLRVDGLDRELRCEAIVDARTLRVTAALPPFLRLQNDVNVVRLDGGVGVVRGAAAPEARGVISRIAVDPNASDGVPRLALDVELDGDTEPVGGGVKRTPPTALPRPYRPALPSVLLSERFATELVSDAPSAPTAPPRRRGARTAELALRLVDRLTGPPSRADEDLTRKTYARAPAPAASVPSAAWLFVPFLLAAIAVLLVSHASLLR